MTEKSKECRHAYCEISCLDTCVLNDAPYALVARVVTVEQFARLIKGLDFDDERRVRAHRVLHDVVLGMTADDCGDLEWLRAWIERALAAPAIQC